jgi:hypothetical protein
MKKYRITFVQRVKYAMPEDAPIAAVDSAQAEQIAWDVWERGEQVEFYCDTDVVVEELDRAVSEPDGEV